MPPENNLNRPFPRGELMFICDFNTKNGKTGYNTSRGFFSVEDYSAREKFGGDKMIHQL